MVKSAKAPPTAKAPSPVPPTDPVTLLRTPLHQAGLTAGPTLRRAGVKLGWYDVRDLLFHLPRRYQDLREMQRLGDLGAMEDGVVVSAQVRVVDIHVEASWRRRIQRTVARLEDDTGTVKATWFGRRYIERRLHAGDQIVVSGRLKRFGRDLLIDNPEFQEVGADGQVLMAGRIVPVYRLTAGLTAARLRVAMREALDGAGHAYPEYLPASLRGDLGLEPIEDPAAKPLVITANAPWMLTYVLGGIMTGLTVLYCVGATLAIIRFAIVAILPARK